MTIRGMPNVLKYSGPSVIRRAVTGNPDTCGTTVVLWKTIRTAILAAWVKRKQPASQPASLLTVQQEGYELSNVVAVFLSLLLE